MKRGEIWLAKWPTDPTAKVRPVLIVSNDMKNSNVGIHDVNIAKITSLQKSNGQSKAINKAEDIIIKLKKDSIVRCGSLYTIEKSFLNRVIHKLTLQELDLVDTCLKNALAL